jgi:acetyl-CoA carboxylase alpha subunit
MTKLILAVLIFSSANLMAASNVQRINNDAISIDGAYSQRTMTQSERMKSLRSKLEKRTEQVLKKKIEQLRFQQELELSRKIQRAFTEKMSALDKAFAEDEGSSAL